MCDCLWVGLFGSVWVIVIVLWLFWVGQYRLVFGFSLMFILRLGLGVINSVVLIKFYFYLIKF